MTTVAMWIHFYLTIAVVVGRAGNRNPIWNELRAVLAGLPVLALWAYIDWSLQ